ncbi:MAG TPA: PLP-dependent aminotransferase family protein, partial [Steroidobacteraceae bacterium]|nr:PLP-dependent aminotransferase family protein [Steroidobacteraceae bacterium]
MTLYQRLADDISALIRDGTLKMGERIPSVREISRERGLSTATVVRAYELLEGQGFIETRPRSGFYASGQWRAQTMPAARASKPTTARMPVSRSTRVDISELVFQVLESVRDRRLVPFGSAFPSPLLFPMSRLARCLSVGARRMDQWGTLDDLPPGSIELRRQIARRYLRSGVRVSPDEIVITSGALEALNLSLQVLTRPGDIVAVESPAFYGCLQAIEAQRLRAVEIPSHPRYGVDVAAFARTLARHPVRACWLMTNFQNPLGALVPEETKRELVALLEKHDIPVIEDDVYAELFFGRQRPKPLKAFDSKGLVLNCNSFSKSLAPGYRVGWVAAGRFAAALQRRKLMSSLSTSAPAQDAIALYLREGGYERHLSTLRRALAAQQAAAIESLSRHLPADIRISHPEGGYFLWLELPDGRDAIEIH